jgi:hypothetical protein
MSVHNFRINFLNINGGTKDKLYDILNECKRKEIDVFGLAHINTRNMKPIECERIIQRAGFKAVTNLQDDENNKGIIIIIKNEFHVKIKYKDLDNRIVALSLTHIETKIKINIITLYGIPNQKDSPNKIFYENLNKGIKMFQEEDLILIGDFNAVDKIAEEIISDTEEIYRPQDKFYIKLKENEFRERLPKDKNSRFTFKRNNYEARLDHILTRGVWNIEVKFQNSVTKSDHKEIQTKTKIKKTQREEIQEEEEEVTTIKMDINKLKLSNEEENHKETIMKRIKNGLSENANLEEIMETTKQAALMTIGTEQKKRKTKANKNYFSHDIYRMKIQKRKLLNWKNKTEKYEEVEDIPINKLMEIGDEFPIIYTSKSEAIRDFINFHLMAGLFDAIIEIKVVIKFNFRDFY